MGIQETPAESIFSAVLLMDSEADRVRYLDKACGGDAELRAQIERLLKAHPIVGNFLASPPSGLGLTATIGAADFSVREAPGTVIGPYKLLQQIGEGGMGVVFLAEQTHPVRRQVALKVIKAGMDTRQVVGRFEAERQALALMDHPNIAKVLDAGATDSGRPYFVMELVKGVPITRYCDEHRLTPRDRLALFVQVCQAVQHAHTKGIIHRDLKPSNVMIALYDGRPVPKVIDFGVAKATGGRLTEATLFTGFGAVVGTPEYMSPEQAELNQLDIDTRSDVYSLGVILYELLTGSTPLERKQLNAVALMEVLRVVREQDPPRPSTRLSTTDKLASIAASRGLEPKKLGVIVRGELDWIVMRALEKDRNRRYETANGFAMDVQRYLADEAVQACPPSASYRLRKFARRNKVGLAVAGLVLTFLVLLGSGIGWAVRDREARRAKVATQVESIFVNAQQLMKAQKWDEALAVAKRAEAALASGDTDAAAAGRVREMLKDLEFVDRLERSRTVEATVIDGRFNYAGADREFSIAFRDYGVDVDALPVETTIDRLKARPELAIPLGTALDAWAIARRAAHRRDAAVAAADWKRLVNVARGVDPEPMRNRIRSTWGQTMAKVEDELRDLAKSTDVHEQNLATIVSLGRNLGRSKYAASGVRLLRDARQVYPDDFWVNFELGSVLNERLDPQGALPYYTAAVSIRPNSAGAYNNLGQVLASVRKRDEAVTCFRKAIDLDPRLAEAYGNLGNTLHGQNKLDEAIAAFRKALELDPKFSAFHSCLGSALRDQGKLDAAVAACRKAIDLDPTNLFGYTDLSSALRAQHKLDEAAAACRTALAINPNCFHAHHNLGTALFDQNKTDEAIAAFRRTITLNPTGAGAHTDLGAALIRQKKYDEALAVCRKAVELDPELPGSYVNLGLALAGQKKLDEAVAAYGKAVEIDPKCAGAYANLGTVLRDLKKLDEAVTAFQKAVELDPKLAAAHSNLGGALLAQKKPDDAMAAFRKAIELDPKLPQGYVGIGDVFLAKDKLDEAIAAYRQAIDIDPSNADWHHNVAALLNRQNKLNEAAVAYRKAIEVDPSNPKRHFILGCFFHGRNYAEAAAAYRAATRLDPNYPQAFGFLGDALHQQKKSDEAIFALRRAIEVDPGDAIAYCGLGEALKDEGKLDAAVAAFRRALELNPKYARAVSGLGRALQAQGKLDEAIEAHRKSVMIDPTSVTGRISLAYALYTQKQFDAAITVIRKTTEIAPSSTDNHLLLALVLKEQGKFDQAIAACRKAVEVEPAFALAHGYLGGVLRDAGGKTAEAIAAYEEAIRLSPRGAGTIDELAWILATCPEPEFRNTARAVELSRKAVALVPTSHAFRITLGVAHYRARNWKAALEALDESTEMRKGGDGKDWFFRAMIHWQLGDKEAARTWYAQAVRWTDKHQPGNEELRRFQAEAAELLEIEKK